MRLPLCLVCVCLAPLTHAGLALIHQGLGRSRSAAQTMVATLCAMATAAIVFVAVGAHFAGAPGDAAHTLHLAGLSFDWLGAQGPSRLLGMPGSAERALVLVLEMFAAGLVAILPISTGSDRWRLAAICVATVPLAGFVFPLYLHAVWGGGWLHELLHATDVSGGGVVQCVGGLAALSVAWVLGPRVGKYAGGQPNAIPGHNIIQVMQGCMMALVGWVALGCACGILFNGAPDERLVLVPLNAMLSASAALLVAVLHTRLRYRKPDASISANGWIAGLVAQSAGSYFFTPLEAVLVGAVAGTLVPWMIELLEMHLMMDDPGGAIAIHLGAGVWGLLAAGLFAANGLPLGERFLAALAMLATLLGLVFPLIHCINLLLARLVPFRVDRDGDWHGMDVRELGSGAYPEFVLHADDTIPR